MSVSLAKSVNARIVYNSDGTTRMSDFDRNMLLCDLRSAYVRHETNVQHGMSDLGMTSYKSFLFGLLPLFAPGRNSDNPDLRAHCAFAGIVLEEEIVRIDRECAEISALLRSHVWDADN